MPTLSCERMAALFVRALEDAGATVLETHSHYFPGAGLTCVLVLAESHAVLHAWPDTGTASVEIYSCSPRLRSADAVDTVAAAFQASCVSIRDTPRSDGDD